MAAWQALPLLSGQALTAFKMPWDGTWYATSPMSGFKKARKGQITYCNNCNIRIHRFAFCMLWALDEGSSISENRILRKISPRGSIFQVWSPPSRIPGQLMRKCVIIVCFSCSDHGVMRACCCHSCCLVHLQIPMKEYISQQHKHALMQVVVNLLTCFWISWSQQPRV